MKEYTYNIINDVYNWMISKEKNIELRILKENLTLLKLEISLSLTIKIK